MYKIIRASKDAYITNKVIKGQEVTDANTGMAGTLDVFKLLTTQPNGTTSTELSRCLIQFDLDDVRDLITAGKINTTDPSFSARLKLFDVYGGQTTPRNFTLVVHPLSQSFDEGVGRDVAYYSDVDVCNFYTASSPSTLWNTEGCGLGGISTSVCDYIEELPDNTQLGTEQLFVTGEENLIVDVTHAISATLNDQIPDHGFRIALDAPHEIDTRSYFVKRFCTRHAYDHTKHPQLIITFDDSIIDDSTIAELDNEAKFVLYNYSRGSLSNITLGGVPVTGSNCISLSLRTPISGGYYTETFTGSQHQLGDFVTGVYECDVLVSSTTPEVAAHVALTGSVDFTPIWHSLDEATTFSTGDVVTFKTATRTSTRSDLNSFVVTATGLRACHDTNDTQRVRVNIFDYEAPNVTLPRRVPFVLPTFVFHDVHYSVRDAHSGDVVVPYDTTYNSTRLSADGSGMFFDLDMSNFTSGRSYIVDILIVTNDTSAEHKSASQAFKVDDLR